MKAAPVAVDEASLAGLDHAAQGSDAVLAWHTSRLTRPAPDHVGGELSRPIGLSVSAERRLAIQIEQGDQAAKQRMIESNLRLVVSLARTYRGRGVPMSDPRRRLPQSRSAPG
jgi:hypothetical protein